MADPIITRAVDQIATNLGNITTANGYTFDANVKRLTQDGPITPKDKDVVVWPQDSQEIERRGAGAALESDPFMQGILIVRALVFGRVGTSSDPIDRILGRRASDVAKVIGAGDPTLGGLVQRCWTMAPLFMLDYEPAFVVVPIPFHYTTFRDDPTQTIG